MDWSISSEKQYYGLAYTFGFFLGDGTVCTWLDKTGKVHKRLMLRKPDRDPIDYAADQIFNVLGKRYSVGTVKYANTSMPMIQYQAGETVFDVFFYETNGRTRPPQWIFSAPDEVKAEFLAGLIDSDGHVSYAQKSGRTEGQMHCQVGFTSTDEAISAGCAAIARQLGISIHSGWDRSRMDAAKCTKPRFDVTFNVKSFLAANIPLKNLTRIVRLDKCREYLLGSETLYVASATSDEDKVHA